mmetsp:Transcript_1111/g.1453  ORF Transcript_1111/g.1453 Transcript_1111/m.1453 type:complete len:313 (+) Transcript_1111:50-988(+)
MAKAKKVLFLFKKEFLLSLASTITTGFFCSFWPGFSSLNIIFCCFFAAYLPYYFDGGPFSTDRAWPAFQRLHIWKLIARSFPVNIVSPHAFDAKKQHLFAVHPHGVASANHLFTLTDGCGFLSTVFPGPRRDLSASIIFRIPFFREFCLWLGCVDASKKMATKVLSEGFSTLILVGGEQEQVRARPGDHTIYLKRRKGFVRLALEHGCALVPVYAWGENDLYYTSSFLLGLRIWIVKTFRVAIPLFIGRLFWPLKRPLTLVFGKPLEVEKVENPTTEQVDALHQKYIESLQQLFEDTREEYGKQPKAVLKIL